MIKKILWTTDGSKDSLAAFKYAELLAQNCKADIFGLTVLSDDYGFLDGLPSDESSILRTRIQKDLELTGVRRFENLMHLLLPLKDCSYLLLRIEDGTVVIDVGSDD